MKLNKKITLIIIILLIAFLARLIPIRIAHFWDETVYLQHAEILFSGRDNFSELSFRPPFISILFFFGFFIFHSPVTASILVAIIGSLGALFTYLIGKKYFNETTGIIGGLIFAFSPFITLNSNYLLTDIPAIVFVSIAFYLALFEKNKFFLFLSGILFSISVLTKFTSILMFPIFLYFFITEKYSYKKILIFISGALVPILPYLIWAQINLGNFMTPFIVGQTMVSDRNESNFFYLQYFPDAYTNFIFLGLCIWLIVFILFIIKKDYKKIKKQSVFILWIILFLVYLTITPHKELRYILPITIPTILLSAQGLSFLLNKINKNYRTFFWCFFIFCIIYIGHSTYAWKSIAEHNFVDRTITDEMKISYYLKEIKYTGIIYSNQRYPVLAYYTGLKTIPLFPDDYKFYTQYNETMKTNGILIGMYGVKTPQPDWLENNPQFTHLKSIGNFFIYSYNNT